MRRAALAHIVYNVGVGILGMILLRPIAAAGDWVGAQLDDPDGVLALAAFSSIFKFVGVAAFFPWLEGFSRVIVKISGTGAESALAGLEPTLAEAGGPVALEAAWRAILETARASVDAVRRRLAGEAVRYDPPIDALRQTDLGARTCLETVQLGAQSGPRGDWKTSPYSECRPPPRAGLSRRWPGPTGRSIMLGVWPNR